MTATTARKASAATPLLQVRDLVVTYGHGRNQLRAVDGVSFDIDRGRTLGIIGESGSGKSTLAQAVAGVVPVTNGSIDIAADVIPAQERRSHTQMVFQDPALALNPRLAAWRSIAEPMAPRSWRLPMSLRAKAEALLAEVGLGPEYAESLPGQLSGGQKQRVTIARAVAAAHPLILCDEPVSALDASLQVGVLKLLAELAEKRRLSYLLISHDLTSVAFLADQIAVMFMGRFVEVGPTRSLLARPRHPYTRALVDAVPRITRGPGYRLRDNEPGGRFIAREAVTDPRNPPSGCRFRLRCPFATDLCATSVPPLVGNGDGDTAGPAEHRTACHHWKTITWSKRPPDGPPISAQPRDPESDIAAIDRQRSALPRGEA